MGRSCLCKLDGESVDHLLLHSKVARTLWNTILSRFGLSWVMPNNLGGLNGLLVVWGQYKERSRLEDGAFLPYVVHMEGKTR
jgi:hypothetical protein